MNARAAAVPIPLGRRPGENATRDAILDAAEEEFAASGFALTSLRAIAERAGVNQALIRYYFGSKEGLFHVIYARGANHIAEARLKLLDALEARPEPPTVEDLVRVFLAPAIEVRRKGAVGAAFMRLQARMQQETEELVQQIRQDAYDAMSLRFVAALQRALPDVEPKTVYWRYVFMVGGYLYTISDANRLAELTGGSQSTAEIDEAVRQMVAFFVAGFTVPG